MFKLNNHIKSIISIIIFCVALLSCSKNKVEGDKDQIIKKKRINPNVIERAAKARDEGGGIFNSSRSKSATTYEFATSNVLWRATLENLEFMPLNNVDYSGGIIVTDWYSVDQSDESIKLTIRFLSNELKVSSVKVVSHKKVCNSNGGCKVLNGSKNLNESIKENIINTARKISVQDEEKK